MRPHQPLDVRLECQLRLVPRGTLRARGLGERDLEAPRAVETERLRVGELGGLLLSEPLNGHGVRPADGIDDAPELDGVARGVRRAPRDVSVEVVEYEGASVRGEVVLDLFEFERQ